MSLVIFLSLIIFFETIIIFIFLQRRNGRRRATEIAKKKFSLVLNPTPKFRIDKSDKFYVKQKAFIETADVGVYLMRLFYVKPHKHLQTESILFILKGEAKVTLGKKTLIVKPGDFLYVPSKVVHHWEVVGSHTYVEYLEFNSPSFAQTNFEDTIWS